MKYEFMTMEEVFFTAYICATLIAILVSIIVHYTSKIGKKNTHDEENE